MPSLALAGGLTDGHLGVVAHFGQRAEDRGYPLVEPGLNGPDLTQLGGRGLIRPGDAPFEAIEPILRRGDRIGRRARWL